MAKRIAALVFIFVSTSAAWMILGATIFARTQSSDRALKGRVASTWGAPQEQSPPTASYLVTEAKRVESEENGKKVTRTVEETSPVFLPLESSRVEVSLDLEHRQKGLLWYSTYKVGFAGDYVFRNTSDREQQVDFTLDFPAAQAIYDDLVLVVDDTPLPITNLKSAVRVSTRLPAGATARLRASYRSQGLESWRYKFGDDVTQVRDFQLHMRTNFQDIDFADNTLSPTDKRLQGSGWDLTWTYKNLLTGYQIGMPMPEKLQPGPLAGQISFFAPVSLFFFFFVLFILTTLRDIELHPMNYFFLAAAFFAFHLLLAYLVDHISIHAAFLICSAVSLFLVVSYLRLVVGMRFAAVEAAGAQFLYLVLFSYAFFFQGFTGLAITLGAILTLFVVMQATGRIRWAEKFSRKPAPPPS
jgi:inner membrane protein involved in colicin E2 resistance